MWQGMYAQALTTLNFPSTRPDNKDSLIEILAIKCVAHARLHEFPEAEEALGQARQMCQASLEVTCGDVITARGVLAVQRTDYDSAKKLFEQALQFARAHNDAFLEATAILNLGLTSLREEHYDKAIDWTEHAYKTSSGFGAIAEKALGNLGWDYYYLGDFERSLEISLKAEKLAAQLGADTDRLTWITAVGSVYARRGDFAAATRSYQKALDLANKTGGQEAIHDSYRALALVSVEDGKLEDARRYFDRAIEIAQSDENRLEELYPLLVKGLIAARSHNPAEAERIFREVETDPKTNASLKFRAEYALARLHEDQGGFAAADRAYRAALKTIEVSRSEIKRLESKLPFSNNARRVYDDYVHFLVANKKTDDALRWADFSRARTLKEGLGYLPKGGAVEPPALDEKQIARRAGGTLLFYWLGEKQSYLWAITPQKKSFFTLLPGKKIDDAVRRYNEALKVQNVLKSADPDGRWLYGTLIEPAQALLKKDAKAIVIPDGSLNNLNFETLLVSDAKLSEPKLSETAPSELKPEANVHYWIEDATIADASSLRVLAAVRTGKQKRGHTLLIVGGSVAPNDKYPGLPLAAGQMEKVESHFSAREQKILTREQATPLAYLASSPEQFSYIHFVAHGISSQLSPLDSFIVLSRSTAEEDSFMLHARDIVNYHKLHPLRAELVTISACYSAGETPYSGEGLVGLSWAFLIAGAHNVVAALWEVSDASTVLLMDKFYDELNKGGNPASALRAAKLSLLRSSKFHDSFYWAPFQLYTRLG